MTKEILYRRIKNMVCWWFHRWNKYRNFIFEYIREDFLDKVLGIKSKEATDLNNLTISQNK